MAVKTVFPPPKYFTFFFIIHKSTGTPDDIVVKIYFATFLNQPSNYTFLTGVSKIVSAIPVGLYRQSGDQKILEK
jgi:hypothetical protein